MGAEIRRDICQAASTRASRSGDRWYLDEVYLSINGKHQYLWRAVDQDGEVLDTLVQPRRNKKAAKNLFRKLLKGLQYIQDKRSNNRAEKSHQPTRERERQMRSFKSAGHAQRFLASFGVITSFFRPGRHLLTAKNYRELCENVSDNGLTSFNRAPFSNESATGEGGLCFNFLSHFS